MRRRGRRPGTSTHRRHRHHRRTRPTRTARAGTADEHLPGPAVCPGRRRHRRPCDRAADVGGARDGAGVDVQGEHQRRARFTCLDRLRRTGRPRCAAHRYDPRLDAIDTAVLRRSTVVGVDDPYPATKRPMRSSCSASGRSSAIWTGRASPNRHPGRWSSTPEPVGAHGAQHRGTDLAGQRRPRRLLTLGEPPDQPRGGPLADQLTFVGTFGAFGPAFVSGDGHP